MPAQTATKATTMVGTDGWALTAHIKRLSETTRSIIPVADQTERDDLPALFPGGVLPNPSYIARTDLPSQPIFRWDGSTWTQITGLQHAEYTGPAFTTSPGTGTNFGGPGAGLFVVDGAKTFNNAFVQPDAAGKLKILQNGDYAISGIILPTTVPASYSLDITNTTTTDVLACIGGVGYGNKQQSVSVPTAYLTAGTILTFGVVTSNAVTIGSRVRIAKLA